MFNVDDKYDLPRDVVHKDSLIEIIGRNEFVVENYRCLKEIKDNERKYNSEPNKDLENKREEYLNKFSEINNEVSEFNYSGTDTQIKDTYSLVLKKWDNALNEIYNDLKNILSSTDMELLRIAQKDWVIRRDKRAEEDSKMYGSNSTEEIEYTKSLADSTKERYYELIENYL